MHTSNTLKNIFKICNNFKVNRVFWDKDGLTGDECTFIRSKPGPYFKTAIEVFKLLNFKTIVEIGSTRLAASNACVAAFNNNVEVDTPPCCCDGHSTFFWATNNFDTHTVDIDESCAKQLLWSFQNVGLEIPQNLHIHIPQDGIEFLHNFDGVIDALFLDGWDVGTPQYAEKHVEAFLASKSKLAPINCILIDDTDFKSVSGGKDKLLTPLLIEEGYIPLFSGRQSLFIKIT